jgi:hypothetical protein
MSRAVLARFGRDHGVRESTMEVAVSGRTSRKPLLCRLNLHDTWVRSSTDGYLYYRKYCPDCGEVLDIRAALYKGEVDWDDDAPGSAAETSA